MSDKKHRDPDPLDAIVDRKAADPNPEVVTSKDDPSYVEPAKRVKPLRARKEH